MKQTNPEDFAELLELFRIALINQIIDRQKVIAWTDELIEREGEPAYFFIEISLCGKNNINDMISLLDNCVGENKPQIAGRVMLGYLYQAYYAKHISLQKVAETFHWLRLHGDFLEDEQSLITQLEVDYELAVDGVYSTVVDVEKHTLDFLIIYQEFNLDNRQHWNEINLLVPDRLATFHQQASQW